MNDHDFASLIDIDPPANSAKPCCKGCADSTISPSGIGELPPLDALNADLDLALADGGDLDSELALAGIDSDLALDEDLGVPDPVTAPPVSIEELVAVAQHYPGLKITLSF